MKPHALYYRILQYQPSNRALLDARFEVTELDDPRQDTDAALDRAEVLFAPLGYNVDEAKMRRAPRLQAIVSNTTGIPHIDAVAAERRGIRVCALHDEPGFLDRITPTAELTIGLMIACMRWIPAASRAAAEGMWDRRPWGAPRMLSRLRLGVVGYGRLGRKVAAAGAAFGMDVAWFDPYVAGGLGTLEALAARSDVLSLHAPANAETAGLVSRAVLERLPPGAVVVNTARGELLDTDALLDLLESGHLYAAALDTVAGEYDPAQVARFRGSRLAEYARAHDNLLLTPHIGGSTVDAWSETERFVIEKACRALGLPAARP